MDYPWSNAEFRALTMKAMKGAPGPPKRTAVIEIPGAHHYMFLNEQGVVLQHIQSFFETVPK
jgi:hypothetical protein